MNREQWLQDAVEHLAPVFKQRTGLGLPDVHESVGWPSTRGLSAKRRTVGQCWPTQEHGAQIFISPLLDDAFDVLAVLVHELVHAFLYESGLSINSLSPSGWASNEEMTDWMAIQGPKL